MSWQSGPSFRPGYGQPPAAKYATAPPPPRREASPRRSSDRSRRSSRKGRSEGASRSDERPVVTDPYWVPPQPGAKTPVGAPPPPSARPVKSSYPYDSPQRDAPPPPSYRRTRASSSSSRRHSSSSSSARSPPRSRSPRSYKTVPPADRDVVYYPHWRRPEGSYAWPPAGHQYVAWTGRDYEMRPPPNPTRDEYGGLSPYRGRRGLKVVKCVDLTDAATPSSPGYY